VKVSKHLKRTQQEIRQLRYGVQRIMAHSDRTHQTLSTHLDDYSKVDIVQQGLAFYCVLNASRRTLPMKLRIRYIDSGTRGAYIYHSHMPSDLSVFISQQTKEPGPQNCEKAVRMKPV
jgi:hypothetical protein